jgi:acyl-ACP thioesterase
VTTDERRFARTRRVYLGDASTRGRLRLDAVARFLQDVAADDSEDAHLPGNRAWVVRRMELTVSRLPAIYEDVELVTWCSGVGGRWAERATSLTSASGVGTRGVGVDARAVWVYVNLETGAPQSLPPEFFDIYGERTRERKVSARLVHPAPPPDAPRTAWRLRTSDFDVLGHVNNAAYWQPVEDELARRLPGARVRRAEIEFRAGIDPGEEPDVATSVTDGALALWFLVGDEVRASVRVEPAEGAP